MYFTFLEVALVSFGSLLLLPAEAMALVSVPDSGLLYARQGADAVSVCGVKCTTSYMPRTVSAGDGPDPNDCRVISDTIRFLSQNSALTNTIPPGGNLTMRYNTCESFFLNKATTPLTYCRLDWAPIVDHVALTSKLTHHAGGDCVAEDGSWLFQWVLIPHLALANLTKSQFLCRIQHS
ncbi:hypothetical protein B0H34DRAFT_802904 [Crassisporium funariophilum]|nr:hypothetical protein B0H34DRAFT_802904 [Crassisporium funariophilum]